MTPRRFAVLPALAIGVWSSEGAATGLPSWAKLPEFSIAACNFESVEVALAHAEERVESWTAGPGRALINKAKAYEVLGDVYLCSEDYSRASGAFVMAGAAAHDAGFFFYAARYFLTASLVADGDRRDDPRWEPCRDVNTDVGANACRLYVRQDREYQLYRKTSPLTEKIRNLEREVEALRVQQREDQRRIEELGAEVARLRSRRSDLVASYGREAPTPPMPPAPHPVDNAQGPSIEDQKPGGTNPS